MIQPHDKFRIFRPNYLCAVGFWRGKQNMYAVPHGIFYLQHGKNHMQHLYDRQLTQIPFHCG